MAARQFAPALITKATELYKGVFLPVQDKKAGGVLRISFIVVKRLSVHAGKKPPGFGHQYFHGRRIPFHSPSEPVIGLDVSSGQQAALICAARRHDVGDMISFNEFVQFVGMLGAASCKADIPGSCLLGR